MGIVGHEQKTQTIFFVTHAKGSRYQGYNYKQQEHIQVITIFRNHTNQLIDDTYIYTLATSYASLHF